MAEAFLRLSGKDRLDALGVAADRLGRPAHLLEKDVWVVWAIQQLFESPVGTNLVFKGGTSLSKAYQVIDRFSEDVDLTFDIRALIPDLLQGREDAMPATSSEERRWSKRVRQALPEWVAGTIQPILQQAIDRECPPHLTWQGHASAARSDRRANGSASRRRGSLSPFPRRFAQHASRGHEQPETPRLRSPPRHRTRYRAEMRVLLWNARQIPALRSEKRIQCLGRGAGSR